RCREVAHRRPRPPADHDSVTPLQLLAAQAFAGGITIPFLVPALLFLRSASRRRTVTARRESEAMDSLERFDERDGKTTTSRPVLGAMGLIATAVLSAFLSTMLLIDSALAAERPGARGRALGKVSDEVVTAAADDSPLDLVPVIVQTYGDASDADLLAA